MGSLVPSTVTATSSSACSGARATSTASSKPASVAPSTSGKGAARSSRGCQIPRPSASPARATSTLSGRPDRASAQPLISRPLAANRRPATGESTLAPSSADSSPTSSTSTASTSTSWPTLGSLALAVATDFGGGGDGEANDLADPGDILRCDGGAGGQREAAGKRGVGNRQLRHSPFAVGRDAVAAGVEVAAGQHVLSHQHLADLVAIEARFGGLD